jgi:proteasome lid subunit RPN8/RPN11
MIAHCRTGLPNEACGLLAGAGGVVTAVYCLDNALRSPVEYDLTAQGYLLAADLDEQSHLLGCFHSHPRGRAYPSATDRRRAYWPIVYAILSFEQEPPVLRAYRLIKREGGDPTELAAVAEEAVEIITDGAVDI